MARYGTSATLQYSQESAPNIVTPDMMLSYQSVMNRISAAVSKSVRCWNYAMPILLKLVDELGEMSLMEEAEEYKNSVGVTEVINVQGDGIKFVDPSKKITKGRPKGTEKFKSGVKISQASKKLKLKSKVVKPTQRSHWGNCGMEGHYSSTCNAQSANQSEEGIRLMNLVNEGSES